MESLHSEAPPPPTRSLVRHGAYEEGPRSSPLKAGAAWARELQPPTPRLPGSWYPEQHRGWSEFSPGSQGQCLGIKSFSSGLQTAPDTSAGQRAKTVLTERVERLGPRPRASSRLRRAIFSLKNSKDPLPGALRRPLTPLTAGLVGKEVVPETWPHQPSPEPPPHPSS